MKKLLLILILAFSINQLNAQNEANHRIVFQLTTDDTLAHKALMKQLNNILSVAPTTEIEVVCHGPGMNMLINGKSTVVAKIQDLKKRDVQFMACEFSIKERNIDRNTIITEAAYVKAGIMEIVSKQEQGWSYIKAGF